MVRCSSLRAGAIALVLPAMMLGFIVSAASAESTVDIVKKRGTLVVGSRADLPPLGYMNAKGEFDGFDAEIFRELAKRLGVKLEFRQATSQTMIPMLQSGAIDIGPTATCSKKREEAVDFTIPAVWDAGKVLVRKDSPIKRLADLKGKTIGIVHGSYYGITLKEMFPAEKFVTFTEYPQALAALEAGKVDASPLTLSNTVTLIKERPNLKAIDEDILKDPLAYPVRENDSKWRKWVNWTLQELWKDGKYQQFFKKHLGFEPHFQLWSAYGLQPGI
jgi:polar amino acid transport system substrate-binding protein